MYSLLYSEMSDLALGEFNTFCLRVTFSSGLTEANLKVWS